jgi:hypothetical protein
MGTQPPGKLQLAILRMLADSGPHSAREVHRAGHANTVDRAETALEGLWRKGFVVSDDGWGSPRYSCSEDGIRLLRGDA